MGTFVSLIAFVVALAAHEFAHARVAYALGDTTARDSGRLTLNPLAHIDPMGTLILPAILILTRFPVVFGWAKAVPVDPSNFVSPRKGMMITSAAGPAANFALALVFVFLFKFSSEGIPSFSAIRPFFAYSILINIVLGIFNLIPVPPLDGANILAGILPFKAAVSYMKFSRYGILVLVGLLYLGLFERFIMPVVSFIANMLLR